MLTVCTHPERCAAMETAHAGLAAQLADALTERDRLQRQVTELQDALCGALEGKQFYYEQYAAKCREAMRV